MTTAETRAMLKSAADYIWGFAFAPEGMDPEAWVKRWVRFTRMLDAEAYLDAALMLVPEGWTGLITVRGGVGEEAWLWPGDGTMMRGYRRDGATPALALLAAIQAAREPDDA